MKESNLRAVIKGIPVSWCGGLKQDSGSLCWDAATFRNRVVFATLIINSHQQFEGRTVLEQIRSRRTCRRRSSPTPGFRPKTRDRLRPKQSIVNEHFYLITRTLGLLLIATTELWRRKSLAKTSAPHQVYATTKISSSNNSVCACKNLLLSQSIICELHLQE